MLQLIRSSTGNIVIKVVIFGILIIGMASYAFIDMFTAQVQGTKVATIGHKEIAYEDYYRAYQLEMRRMHQLGITSEMAETLAIGNSVVSRMVTDTVFDAEADDLALTISDEAVVKFIRENQAFLDEFGNFSRAQFEFMLSRNRMNEAMFVETLKSDMARDAYVTSITDAITLPASLSKSLALYRNETREADYMILPLEKAATPHMPSTEELRTFYDNTKSAYDVPELKKFSYILIDPEALAEKIVPSEEDIQAAYDARRAAFVAEEKRNLDQFLFLSQEDAQAAYDRIIAGEDFAAVGEEVTGDGPSTYQLGYVSKGDFLSETAAEYVFSQTDLGILSPIEGDFGWVIYRLNDIQAEEAQPLDEVRAILAPEVALEKAIDQAYDLSSELTDQVSGGATLEEASSSLSLPLVRNMIVDRAGTDGEGTSMTSLPNDNLFLDIIFDALDGDVTAVEQLEGNRFFVAHLEETIPTRTKDFEEVQTDVETAWTQDQKILSLTKQAEELVASINGGDGLSMVSGELLLPLNETGAMNRNGQGKPQDLPDALLSQIFDLDVGQAAFAEFADGVAIAELKSANQEKNDSETASVADTLNRQAQISVVNTLNGALRNNHEVRVNMESVNAVYGGGHAGM